MTDEQQGMEGLRIDELRVIQALAEEKGHLQNAASRLGRSKKYVEGKFEDIATKTGIRMNERGIYWPAERLRKQVDAILKIFDHEWRPLALEIQHDQHDRIRVGTFAYILIKWVDAPSKAFASRRKQSYEPVVMDDDGSGRRIADALKAGEIDVAITYDLPGVTVKTTGAQIAENTLEVLIPPSLKNRYQGQPVNSHLLLEMSTKAIKHLLITKEGFRSRQALIEALQPVRLSSFRWRQDFDNVNVLAHNVALDEGIGVAFGATILQREELESKNVLFTPLIGTDGQPKTVAIHAFRRSPSAENQKPSSRETMLDDYIRHLGQPFGSSST